MYTVHNSLYSLHYTTFTIQCTLHYVHYTVYIIHRSLYNVHCTTFTIQRTLHYVHYTVYIVLRSLYNVHYISWIHVPDNTDYSDYNCIKLCNTISSRQRRPFGYAISVWLCMSMCICVCMCMCEHLLCFMYSDYQCYSVCIHTVVYIYIVVYIHTTLYTLLNCFI